MAPAPVTLDWLAARIGQEIGLSDWIVDAGAPLDKPAAREAIHGMPADEWKAKHQAEATPEQLARMAESLKKNH